MEKTQMRLNAERDRNYRPYCLRCPGNVRMMLTTTPFYWVCRCGAVHDERQADDFAVISNKPIK